MKWGAIFYYFRGQAEKVWLNEEGWKRDDANEYEKTPSTVIGKNSYRNYAFRDFRVPRAILPRNNENLIKSIAKTVYSTMKFTSIRLEPYKNYSEITLRSDLQTWANIRICLSYTKTPAVFAMQLIWGTIRSDFCKSLQLPSFTCRNELLFRSVYVSPATVGVR
jgi:hypothetical protein